MTYHKYRYIISDYMKTDGPHSGCKQKRQLAYIGQESV